MSNELMEYLTEFLKTANLSTYEINAYITLVKSSELLTARDITSKSGVPSGRIYEVLEELSKKGMAEIIESRPKKFRSLPLNRAFYNLISYQSKEHSQKINYLFDQAKMLEQCIFEHEDFIKTEPSGIFWSTATGTRSIISLFVKYYNEAKDEMLFNDFINKSTLKILDFGHTLYEPIKNALDRGVSAKFLWSFQHDDRPLSEIQKSHNLNLFKKIVKKHEELFGISSKNHDLEMKYIHKRTPTLYDIFDKKRIIIKLQNPLKPFQIFSCMNVLDPDMAKELRKKFLSIWTFEALNGDSN
ncbi:MAG: TrmB family transcriptional regulator [Candidatus Hermodarchaeota archaeon]